MMGKRMNWLMAYLQMWELTSVLQKDLRMVLLMAKQMDQLMVYLKLKELTMELQMDLVKEKLRDWMMA